MLKDGTYYATLDGAQFGQGTRDIAERIQAALPHVPDVVALMAALALTSEVLVGTSILVPVRLGNREANEVLDMLSTNFTVAVRLAAHTAGLSSDQAAELLNVAEKATIQNLEQQRLLVEAGNGSIVTH